MGCAGSKEEVDDEAFLDYFVSLANEEYGWDEKIREQDGPRGTKVGSRESEQGDVQYWRGIATFRGPMDTVAWFLRNQTEFNALASTIDPEVLGKELASMHKLDRIEILKMTSANTAHLRFTMQFPSPLPPREFLMVERTTQLPDGSIVVVCRSEVSAQTRKSRTMSSKYQLSTFSLDSGEEDTTPSRPASRPLSASLAALLRAASGSANGGSSSPRSTLAALSGGPQAVPTVKGQAHFVGYLLKPVRDRQFTQVTYLAALDPKLGASDYESLGMFDSLLAPQVTPRALTLPTNEASEEEEEDDEEADDVAYGGPAAPSVVSSVRARANDRVLDVQTKLDMTLGSGRVLAQVESARRYFEDPKTIWAEQLYRLLSAQIGEFGFEPVEAAQFGEERLQTGTHVKSRTMGHGIIKMFDLMGRVHVQFDSGEEHIFMPDEVSTELKAAIEAGTRVRHQQRGLGTVKRFDDEEGTIHVRFDDGEYHRYNAASWKEKFTVVNQDRAYANVNLSKCPQVNMEGITKGSNLHFHAGVTAPGIMRKRGTLVGLSNGSGKSSNNDPIDAEALRISFVISGRSQEILDYILDYAEDEKAGRLVEEHVVQEHSARHRTVYQRVHYPQGLNDRDFVFDTFWQEVDDKTFLVVQKSTEAADVPEVRNVVRANIVIRGFLLEPLYESGSADGPGLMTRVTYLTCVEPGGLVPPKVVAIQNRTELLGVLTDMRSHFYRCDNKSAVTVSLSEGSTQRAKGEVKAKLKRRSLRRRSVKEVLPGL